MTIAHISLRLRRAKNGRENFAREVRAAPRRKTRGGRER